MHLVNVDTLQLEEFTEAFTPRYAILSHRWTTDELTFKEVNKRRIDISKTGYQKLYSACQIVKIHSLQHCWIDTCCIDKRSSAELSEAINSMWSWYANAEVCLAYLADVAEENLKDNVYKSFCDSVWFTRAWTLQELIAPKVVEFFDQGWKYLGSKTSLIQHIHHATKIDREVLLGKVDLSQISITTKMSWAAHRQATRSEDIAYSLLGVFDVNMPMLYGEKTKAFLRLQEELCRGSRDLSFLLWGYGTMQHNLLGSSPADFNQEDPDVIFYVHPSKMPFTLNNIGLEAELPLQRWCRDTYVVPLRIELKARYFHAIVLFKYSDSNIFVRVSAIRVKVAELCPSRLLNTSKVSIARNLEAAGLRARTALNSYSTACPPRHTGFGFRVKCLDHDGTLPYVRLLPICSPALLSIGKARWSEPTNAEQIHTCQLICGNSLSFAPVRLEIYIPGGSFHLYAFLFLDFGFNPCLYLCDYYKAEAAWIYRISQDLNLDKLNASDWMHKDDRDAEGQQSVATSQVEDTAGEMSKSWTYHVRARRRAVVRVPEHMYSDKISTNINLSLKLSSPGYISDLEEMWTFDVQMDSSLNNES